METQSLERSPRIAADPAPPRGVLVRTLPAIISSLAVVAGIALRWAYLGSKSLWFDEGYTAWAISLPVGGILKVIRVDTAPPLYYLLLRGWTHSFGRSEAGMRSMSALIASASLLVCVAIACRLLKSAWGRTAAIVLFSFSFMQIAYAHEARFYAMMTLMGAIDFYLVLLVCERSGFWRLAALVIAWAISLYTNNLMGLYLACLGVAWLILPGRRPVVGRLKDVVTVTLAAGLLYAPWLPAMLAQAKRLQAGFWPAVPDGWLLLRTIGVMAGAHEQALGSADWSKFVRVDAVLAALAVVACISRKNLRLVLALVSFGVVPIIFVYVYSHLGQSIFVERVFLPSGIVMPLLLTLALESVRTRPAKFLAIAGVVWFAWLSFRSLPGRFTGDQTEDWRDACAYADQTPAAIPSERRLTICVANEGEMLYDYYQRHSDYAPRSNLTGIPQDFFQLDPPRTLQRASKDSDLDPLRQTLRDGNYDSIVMICSHSWWGDADERGIALVSKQFARLEERQFPQIRVIRFGRGKGIPR